MSFLISLTVVAHMLCWAVALGLWVAAARTRTPNPGLFHSAAGALVFGLILAALVSIAYEPNHMKLGIKALVALIVVVLALINKKKQEQTPSAVWFGIPAAIVLNVIVAVFL